MVDNPSMIGPAQRRYSPESPPPPQTVTSQAETPVSLCHLNVLDSSIRLLVPNACLLSSVDQPNPSALQ